MLQALLDFIGLADPQLSDQLVFTVLSVFFLFCVSETFRLVEIFCDRLAGRRR